MNGYLISFYTQQDRQHRGQPLGHWLIGLARELELRGATLSAALEGFGHSGELRSARFFEHAQQPLVVRIAATEDECARLFQRLDQEDFDLFYVKTPAELGHVGKRVARDA
ncbi:DUF190 domain-containing protein [Halopseudomonas phragmitis]|uniref:Uncharacterized protein n=2 Tax=Pseudomonadaceae TaxID=135621 RepID=A0A1V0B1Z8_9GAMM|nr:MULTISPECIES: DUF190 domain-containing protein [Pseudomonadaceae]AQZ93963.1 hypothetical protein BVH74_03995 [Halopseudomonas phragmitis]PAU86728.1 hypothetical protein CK507_13615 [Pseudomonas sp. WN033]RHW20546.1 hypothetical protein C2846_12970 [Pseudomonas jilinensis]